MSSAGLLWLQRRESGLTRGCCPRLRTRGTLRWGRWSLLWVKLGCRRDLSLVLVFPASAAPWWPTRACRRGPDPLVWLHGHLLPLAWSPSRCQSARWAGRARSPASTRAAGSRPARPCKCMQSSRRFWEVVAPGGSWLRHATPGACSIQGPVPGAEHAVRRAHGWCVRGLHVRTLGGDLRGVTGHLQAQMGCAGRALGTRETAPVQRHRGVRQRGPSSLRGIGDPATALGQGRSGQVGQELQRPGVGEAGSPRI
jgi:hypothetical protein